MTWSKKYPQIILYLRYNDMVKKTITRYCPLNARRSYSALTRHAQEKIFQKNPRMKTSKSNNLEKPTKNQFNRPK